MSTTASQLLGVGPPHTDFVQHMLGIVLGPVWVAIAKHGLSLSSIRGLPEGPLGAGFHVFNTLVFGFITFYVVKIIFEGVAGTAYHGEWLGKKFHTFWTPMRIVFMLALIAPVSGGYDLAQIVVLWTSSNAITVADKVATTVMPDIAKQGAVYNDPLAPSAKKIAANLFYDYVCLDTLNDPKLNGSSGSLIHVVGTGNKKRTTYNFSGVGDGLPAQTCGSVQLNTPPTPIAMAESTGMSAMLSLIKPAARRFERITSGESKHPQIMPKNLITDAAKAYTHSIMMAVRKYAKKKNKSLTNGWSKHVQKDGFAVLGDFMAQITAYDGKISKLAKFQPQITPPLHEQVVGLQGYDVRDLLSAARAYVQARNPGLSNPKGLSATIPKSQTKGKGWFGKKIDKIVNVENELIGAFNSLGNSGDPLGAVQAFGVRITTITSSLIGLVSVIGGITELVALPAVLAMYGILFPLLIFGLTLGYVIPMLPYLLYTMAVVGWVGAVITATVGAPLWAAAHVLPDDSEGFAPSAAKQGYRLLLSLFAKPSLIVFGFIASLGLFDAGAWYVNKTFLYVSKTVLGGTTSNSAFGAVVGSISGTIAMVFVVVVLYWKLADWCFSMIHTLPDRALEWVGLNDISVNEERAHDTVVAGAVVGLRNTQRPHEQASQAVHAEERAGRSHARQGRLTAAGGGEGQSDEAPGPAGDE